MLTAEMLALSVAPMCVTFAQLTQNHCGSRSTAQSCLVLQRHVWTKKVIDKDTWAHLCMGTWLILVGPCRNSWVVKAWWRSLSSPLLCKVQRGNCFPDAGKEMERQWGDTFLRLFHFLASCSLNFFRLYISLDTLFLSPPCGKIQVLRMLACNGLQLCILSENNYHGGLARCAQLNLNGLDRTGGFYGCCRPGFGEEDKTECICEIINAFRNASPCYTYIDICKLDTSLCAKSLVKSRYAALWLACQALCFSCACAWTNGRAASKWKLFDHQTK